MLHKKIDEAIEAAAATQSTMLPARERPERETLAGILELIRNQQRVLNSGALLASASAPPGLLNDLGEMSSMLNDLEASVSEDELDLDYAQSLVNDLQVMVIKRRHAISNSWAHQGQLSLPEFHTLEELAELLTQRQSQGVVFRHAARGGYGNTDDKDTTRSKTRHAPSRQG